MSYEIFVLSDGYSRLDGEGSMLANCTCTLIKGPKNVIVDTMTPWDGQLIVAGLGKHGLTPVQWNLNNRLFRPCYSDGNCHMTVHVNWWTIGITDFLKSVIQMPFK